MTSTLAIHGALDIDNFGDVLLGRIFCDLARDRGWAVSAPSASLAVRRQLGSLVDSDYESADRILYIGGGYFGEPPRSILGKIRWGRRMVKCHLSVTSRARSLGKEFAVIGVGAGPITDIFARRALRKFLGDATTIAVRDRESASFIRRLGVSREVIQTADAALMLYSKELSAVSIAEKLRLLSLAAGRKIIVLHPAKARESNGFEKLFLALSELDVRDKLIIAISDQSGTSGADEQEVAIKQVLSLFPSAQASPYRGVDNLIGVIAAADHVATTKLHVGIVATALGKSVTALAAHPKTQRFYNQIGAPQLCLPLRQSSTAAFTAALQAGIDSNEGGQFPLLEAQVRLSCNNEMILQRFLSKP